VSEIFLQKLLKSANFSLRYNRWCRGCFFRFPVYFNTHFAWSDFPR